MRTFFDNIDCENKAYWLGFIVADGNLHRNGYGFQINLGNMDRLHLEKLAILLDSRISDWSSFHKKQQKTYRGCSIRISDKSMHQSLCSLGVLPNKTHKDQSKIIDYIPSDLFNHFVRGLFDGDGSISFSRVSEKLICNYTIAGETQLLESLKNRICAFVGISDVGVEKKQNFSVLRWGGRRQCISVGDWMYKNATIFLGRKKNKFVELENQPRSKGTFFGVSKAASGKWNASIMVDGKRQHIGNFATAKDAAIAHDTRAIAIGKPKYKVNFPEMAGI
jgi:hypothetical protein